METGAGDDKQMKPFREQSTDSYIAALVNQTDSLKKTAVHCPNCSAAPNPQALPEMGGAAYLVCSQPKGGCMTPVKSFATEDEMNQYLDNNWAAMEDPC